MIFSSTKSQLFGNVVMDFITKTIISSIHRSVFFLGIIVPFLSILVLYGYLGRRVVLSYLLLAISLFLINNFFRTKRFFVISVLFTSILFAFFVFIEFSFVYVFKHKIGINAIYVLLESNKDEISEFLSVYFKSELFIVLGLFSFAIFFSLFCANWHFESKKTYNVKAPILFKIIALFLCLSIIYIKGSLLPVYTVGTIFDYKRQQQEIKEISLSNIGNFQGVVANINADEEVYILIIGESTTRNHMGLYDYYRKTNPLLSKRKKELLLYKNVISPHTHTLESLDKALILENHLDLEQKYNQTLVQLFNASGFSTYWLSNQEPMGIYGNSTRLISKTSEHEYFTDGMMLDEVVLEPLRKALNTEEKRKFIVVHLMATHIDYGKRYPSNFEVFKSTPRTKFQHRQAYEKINEYDNAVLYNDFIIDTIIGELENKKGYSSILYLSDHGEDVYETINEACHTETKGTKPMFDIPFFIWQSEQFRERRQDIVFDAGRKYSSEDLIHTMADLADIKFEGFDATKSIINISFKEKSRIVLNNKKYEEVFGN